MSAHHRVAGPGCGTRIRNMLESLSQITCAVVCHVVLDRQWLDTAAQIDGQCFECQMHIGEAGVATAGRHFQCIERAESHRRLAIKIISMHNYFCMTQEAYA